MSEEIAVAAENLTFEISLIGDVVKRGATGAKAVGGQIIREGRQTKLRALDGLSFTVAKGSKVGIVGKNGAGKSTLLRVLAGIQTRSSGRLTVNGKISTLFSNRIVTNPHVTGVEMILLSGLLMGLSRKEIEGMMPEIIAFSELEDFIDLPLRTYSAGMATRLGFAVATSISPEILLIDEVFGAGDRQFQVKASERINHVIRSASTLFLASQSLGIIERICDHILWLDHGRLRAYGPLKELLPLFMEEEREQSQKAPERAKLASR